VLVSVRINVVSHLSVRRDVLTKMEILDHLQANLCFDPTSERVLQVRIVDRVDFVEVDIQVQTIRTRCDRRLRSDQVVIANSCTSQQIWRCACDIDRDRCCRVCQDRKGDRSTRLIDLGDQNASDQLSGNIIRGAVRQDASRQSRNPRMDRLLVFGNPQIVKRNI